MTRHSLRWRRVIALGLLLAGGISGCTSGPGGGRSSVANALTASAKELRMASAPPPGIARDLEKQPAEPYVIEPGDVLLVQPASLDSPLRLPGDQVVLPDGTIQLAQYGHLSVVGKTLPMIEGEVNALFKAKLPDAGVVVVRLVTRDSKVFYVLGEVNSPGAFPLRGRETVLDAITGNAGGLNTTASRRNVILSRPTGPGSCRIVLPVHYNAIVQLGDTTTNYQIRAGDRVFVPSSSMWENLCGPMKDKKTDCLQTPCFPRQEHPIDTANKVGTLPMALPAPVTLDPPSTMDIPLPTGPAPKSSDDLPASSKVTPTTTWTPPPGYKPLLPPGV